MPRFLHTADWQIGRQYQTFDPEDAPALIDARFQAVERIAQMAAEQAFDAVLVAGDVFDAQTVSDRSIRRLFNAMATFDGPWALIPGNHDAALAESVWTRAMRLDVIPPNVHIALEPGVMLFPDQGLAVLAAPLTQRHTHSDLTEWFDNAQTPAGLLRIGLAHGSVQGILAEGIDSPNPIAPDRAARARLDYLALGDWHGAKQVDARTWYSGTPEQDRHKSNDAGHVLQVDIAGPGAMPDVHMAPTGQYPWRQWERGLAVASDIDEFIQQLAGLESLKRPCVVDIALYGETDLAGEYRLRDALGRAQAIHRSLRADLSRLRLMPTDDDIADLRADGYLGEVVAELRDTQQGENSDVAREALIILAGLLRERKQKELAQ
jgi:hypothetical protein